MKSNTALSMSYYCLFNSHPLTWIIPVLFLSLLFTWWAIAKWLWVWLSGSQWSSPSNVLFWSRGKIIQLQMFFHARSYPNLNTCTATLLLLAILLKWSLQLKSSLAFIVSFLWSYIFQVVIMFNTTTTKWKFKN